MTLRILSAIPTFKYVSILHCDDAAMTRNDGTPHVCIKQQMALFVELIN